MFFSIELNKTKSSKFFFSGDILCSVLVWGCFSMYGFFGTGHQTTIPAIRFPAAYIGFEGSFIEMVPQGMLKNGRIFYCLLKSLQIFLFLVGLYCIIILLCCYYIILCYFSYIFLY